jgi:hypothetical protein
LEAERAGVPHLEPVLSELLRLRTAKVLRRGPDEASVGQAGLLLDDEGGEGRQAAREQFVVLASGIPVWFDRRYYASIYSYGA